MYRMWPGPWAMSVMMQKLHPSATPGANSVMSPAGVIRAIFAGADVNSVPSVNQRLPSEPLVMARGLLSAVGTLNCFRPPIGAATTALLSDSARPAASTVVSARARCLDIVPPNEVSVGLRGHLYDVRGSGRTVSAWLSGEGDDASVVGRAGDLLAPTAAAVSVEEAQRPSAEPRSDDPVVRLLDVVGIVWNGCGAQPLAAAAVNAQGAAFAARDEDEIAAEGEVLGRFVCVHASQQAPAVGQVDRDFVAVAGADPDAPAAGRPAHVVCQEGRAETAHEPRVTWMRYVHNRNRL